MPKIGIIGNNALGKTVIESELAKNDIKGVVIVSEDTKDNPFVDLPTFPIVPVIPDIKWSDYRDGKTLRRERRKRERKNKR